MKILLSSRSGDMFYGMQHLFRLPPGSVICYTENHVYFREAMEWICPGRFIWESVKEDDFFKHESRSLEGRGDYSVPIFTGGDVAVIDMSENTLSLLEKTRSAFSQAIPMKGPLVIFPTARSSRKEMTLDFLKSLSCSRGQVVLCVEKDRVNDFTASGFPIISKSLTEIIQMAPTGILGTCSFPALLFCWLGFQVLKVHFHPFTMPPRAPLSHLGGRELPCSDLKEINNWLSSVLEGKNHVAGN